MKMDDAIVEFGFDCKVRKLSECSFSGKVDGIFLIRKSFGALKPLLDLVS